MSTTGQKIKKKKKLKGRHMMVDFTIMNVKFGMEQ